MDDNNYDRTLELAYGAAVDALTQQDATLGSLRNRATGVLSTSALATSFASGIGVFNTDPSKGPTIATGTVFVTLALFVGIGVLSTLILWSVSDWNYGPDARLLIQKTDDGLSLDEVHRSMADALTECRDQNAVHVRRRHKLYRCTAVLLIIEIAVIALSAMNR